MFTAVVNFMKEDGQNRPSSLSFTLAYGISMIARGYTLGYGFLLAIGLIGWSYWATFRRQPYLLLFCLAWSVVTVAPNLASPPGGMHRDYVPNVALAFLLGYSFSLLWGALAERCAFRVKKLIEVGEH
jgi:hypothetical protein